MSIMVTTLVIIVVHIHLTTTYPTDHVFPFYRRYEHIVVECEVLGSSGTFLNSKAMNTEQ